MILVILGGQKPDPVFNLSYENLILSGNRGS